jgi:hypothetical protein
VVVDTAAVDETDDDAGSAAGTTQKVEPQLIKSGDRVKLEIRFDLPDEYKLNDDFPVKYTIAAADDQKLVAADQLGKKKAAELKVGKAIVDLPLAQQNGVAELKVTLTYGYCRIGSNGLCKSGTSTWSVPIQLSAEGKSNTVNLTASPQP